MSRGLCCLVALGACTLGAHAVAAGITCHYDYGGEAHTLPVSASRDPASVPAIRIGSYFLFRVVWQHEPAAVRVYTYGDTQDGPSIVHQGTWPATALNSGAYGFTGLQRVYEPVRDSELEYWCEQDAETVQ